MIVTETPRLSLRQFKGKDSTALIDIFGDAAVMRYGDGIQTPAWVRRWILEVQNSYRTWGYGKWAVTNKKTDLLGYCGLSHADDVCGQSEITLGYRLARRYWGQGYASEAVAATIHYGFDTLGLKRLVATIDPCNTASIRVAEKAGLVYEQDVMFGGYTHPDRVYVLKKSDWAVRKNSSPLSAAPKR